jgi:hypothetical protein
VIARPVFSSGAAWSRRAAAHLAVARSAHVNGLRFGDAWWTAQAERCLAAYNAARCTAAERRRLDTLFEGI